MQAEQVVDILEEVNEHLLEGLKQFVPEMLEAVSLHVNAAGPDAGAAYVAAKQRLEYSMQPLIDPRTGQELEG
jgi:hypothetical protein